MGCQPGSGPPATTSAPSPVPVQPETTPAPSPEPAQPVTMPAPLPEVEHPTPSPPSGPQTCMDFCPKSVQPSCSALSSSRSSCDSSYYMKYDHAMPCRWTACGWVADGDVMLECPDLTALCSGGPSPGASRPLPVSGSVL